MKFTVTQEHWDRALELEASRKDVGISRRCAATLAVLDAIGRSVEQNLLPLSEDGDGGELVLVWSACGLVGIDGTKYDGGESLRRFINDYDRFAALGHFARDELLVKLPVEFELVPK